MEYFANIIEYYDELYPVLPDETAFFRQTMSEYKPPCKILTIGCGTGSLEHAMVKNGADVTGLDTSKEMLETANRRKKDTGANIRFFQMTTLEMTRFLGKDFYNVIACLNDRIILIRDKTLMRKFFYDCKTLLAKEGRLILQLMNYNLFSSKPMAKLPTLESIRVSLSRQIWTDDSGKTTAEFELENGAGKLIPVIKDTEVYPLQKDEKQQFAVEAGFGDIQFYADFSRVPFTQDSQTLLCVLS